MAQIETEQRDAEGAADLRTPESASACCGTAAQATCCEKSEKAVCCGTPDPETQLATRCGCR